MFLGKHQDQGDVVDCARIAHAAPPLRRELAHVFTLRTECHPENKCPLTLVLRSSGLILAFLNPSQRHAPLAANTARNRQHGAPTRRGGAVDWLNPLPHSTHFGHTRGSHAYTSQRRYVWGGGGHKESDRSEGSEHKMPAVGPGASER